MNIFGKVLVWLIVLAAPAAIALSARAVQVRNSWTQKVFNEQGMKREVEENAKKLAEARRKRSQLETDLSLTLLGWDQFWDNVTVGVSNAGAGTITATAPGLTFAESQVVFGFKTGQGGASEFVGPFRFAGGTLSPLWRFRSNEPANWGGTWRFRAMVPVAHKDRFNQLDVFFTRADELAQAKQEAMARQQTLLDEAKQHLVLRMQELLDGDANLEADRDKLPAELVDGLASAIKQAEADRNAVAAEVDRLRRELKVKHEQFLKLKDDNIRSVERLAPPRQPVVSAK